MKRKKTIFVIESLLGLLILVTACHKEDISTLYSRQYQLSAEITGINAEILRINNEIVELKNLYTILANKGYHRSRHNIGYLQVLHSLWTRR